MSTPAPTPAPRPPLPAPAPQPKPEPALWEWVRAACESRLGEPTLRGGALRWTPAGPSIYAEREADVWHVYKSHATHAAICRTPAELTAALDALAEEVGYG